VAPARHNPSTPGIIGDKSYQTQHHHQRVPLHQTPFQQPHGIGQHPRKYCGTVYQYAVDDPFVPPTGERTAEASDPAGAVYYAIDYVRVKPGCGFARAHHAETSVSYFAAAGESVVISFVDVILVVEHVVESRGFGGVWFAVVFVSFAIGAPRHAPADYRSAD